MYSNKKISILFLIIFITNSVNCYNIDYTKSESETKTFENTLSDYTSILFAHYTSEINKYYSGFLILMKDLSDSLHKTRPNQIPNNVDDWVRVLEPQNDSNRTNSTISSSNLAESISNTMKNDFSKSNCQIGKEIKSNITIFTCESEDKSKNIFYKVENKFKDKSNESNAINAIDGAINSANCENKTEEFSFCLCPKTNNRCSHTVTNDLICKFEIVKLNIISFKLYADDINLLKNKDTFYYEYLNSTKLKYKNKQFEYRAKLKCRDRVTLPADNFVVFGDFDLNFNTTELLRQNNVTENIFDYFLDAKNITLYEQPELQVQYSIYNMNTILPEIVYKYDIDSGSVEDVLKGDKEVNFFVDLEDRQETDYRSLLLSNRLFYEIKLIDAKFGSVKYLYYQGVIDFDSSNSENFLNNEASYAIFVPISIFLIIISMFFVYRLFSKKRRNSTIIEDMDSKENIIKSK